MKELFPGYYRPTNEEFSKMWRECIFVFDANVLLNIYRYSSETRDELFDVLGYIKDRVWMPHQAMLEYHENREEVISQQYTITEDIENALTTASKTIEAKYRRGHPFADTKIINDAIKEAINKIKASIALAESKYPNLLQNDYLLERITHLFRDRVGNDWWRIEKGETLGQVKQEAIEEIKEVELNQRHRSKVLSRHEVAEIAVALWLKVTYKYEDVELSEPEGGISYILLDFAKRRIGVIVKFSEELFHPTDMAEQLGIAKVASLHNLLEKIIVVFVCANRSNATMSLAGIQQGLNVPENVLLVVGYIDQFNLFAPIGRINDSNN